MAQILLYKYRISMVKDISLKAIISTLFVMVSLIPVMAHAQSYESHDQIIAAVTDLINQNLDDHTDRQIIVTPLDRRLHMAKCTEALSAFINPGTKLIGKTTIGVRCAGDKPWKIYVTATVNLFKEVVIVNEPIIRGTTLSDAQIRLEKRNIASLTRGYYTVREQVIGKIAKYTLNPENIVAPSTLAMPKLVQRGKNVIIIAHTNDFTVKMSGKAMTDGHLGELIKVKNQRSQRIIQAKVIDINRVSVDI